MSDNISYSIDTLELNERHSQGEDSLLKYLEEVAEDLREFATREEYSKYYFELGIEYIAHNDEDHAAALEAHRLMCPSLFITENEEGYSYDEDKFENAEIEWRQLLGWPNKVFIIARNVAFNEWVKGENITAEWLHKKLDILVFRYENEKINEYEELIDCEVDELNAEREA